MEENPTAQIPKQPNQNNYLYLSTVAIVLILLVIIAYFALRQNSSTQESTNIQPSNQSNQTVNNINGGVVFGAQIDPTEIQSVCSSVQQLGVKATTVWVRLGEFEPQKDQYNWSRLDQALKPFFDCGIDVGLHIQMKGARWAGSVSLNDTKKAGGETIPYPSDFENSAQQLATHFKGKIHYYSLENEASGPQWPATAQVYFSMLNSFYQGIKAADPTAVVEDSGTGSEAFGLIIPNQMMQSGQDQQAVNFANEYYSHMSLGDKPFHVNSISDLQNYFQTQPVAAAGLKSTASWMPMLFSSSSLYDIIQVHFYAPWNMLQNVLDYVRSGMQHGGKVRSVDIWEIGYGWSGYGSSSQNDYNPTTHAQDTVKLLTVAAGEGVQRIIYWRFTDTSHKKPTNDTTSVSRTPGLVADSEPNQAGIAYKVTVSKLEGATSGQKLDVGNPNVWVYKFSNKGKYIYVVWATSEISANLTQSGLTGSSVAVTDISGHITTQNSANLAVGISPVFVEDNP